MIGFVKQEKRVKMMRNFLVITGDDLALSCELLALGLICPKRIKIITLIMDKETVSGDFFNDLTKETSISFLLD